MPLRSRDDVPDHLLAAHPGSRWVTWSPKPRGPKWLVRVDVGRSDGRLECIGLEVRSFQETADGGWPPELPLWNENPTPLLRRTLRDLPLGQILDGLGDELRQSWLDLAALFEVDDEQEGTQYGRDIRAQVKRQATAAATKRRGGRDLETIAAVWLDAQSRREPTTKAVANYCNVSESMAAKLVMRVRKESDLLPPPTNQPRKPRRKS